MRNATLMEAAYQQRGRTLRRLVALADATWDATCPGPERVAGVSRPRVRDVVAHLVVVDELVLGGGGLRPWAGSRSVHSVAGWEPQRVAPIADRPGAELLTLLAQTGARFARVAGATPAAVSRVRVGPRGRKPLWHLVGRRVTHEWVHEQDIAAAGRPSIASAAMPPPPVADVVAETVLRDLPETALPRAAVTSGVVRLVVDVEAAEGTGDRVARQHVWGIDFRRRQYGPRVVTRPDATVQTDTATLALVTSGRRRWGWDVPGWVVTGDRGLAGALLETIGVRDDAMASQEPPFAGAS